MFAIVALFHCQFNYSQIDISTPKALDDLVAEVVTSQEKEETISSFSNKEKKLNNFELSVTDTTTFEEYGFHEKYYTVDFPINEVWDAYETAKPNECWPGPLTTYKNSTSNSSFHNFREDQHPPFKEGSIYLVRLKLMPFIKITVVFQLTKLDAAEKLIEMTYGMDNTSCLLYTSPSPRDRG